ncbi:hypothetical protein GCM10022381_02210 [Leifsonia kafniensis]|uniref:Uncharacterized protein n=1 Tax=Leifsonia kafniensis TaxID=475957 RepID=A0ABP7K1R4_9MICO
MMHNVSQDPAIRWSDTGHEIERVHGESGPRTMGDLEVQLVGDGVWRVRDKRLPEHDASCVLGVIEKTRSGYEATRVGRSLECSVTASFSDAAGSFV